MGKIFETHRRVEFRDTDSAGLMHFSAFFTKMEEVEHEFLRSLGTSVVVYDGDAKLSWPRVSASCDYIGATRFEDDLSVQLSIKRLGTKSVTYAFRFTVNGASVANGQLTCVCCRFEPNCPPQSLEIPPQLAEQMQSFMAVE